MRAENRFAEEVDVKVDAPRSNSAELRAETLRRRVNNEVLNHGAKHLAGDRHHNSGEPPGENSAEVNQCA